MLLDMNVEWAVGEAAQSNGKLSRKAAGAYYTPDAVV